MPNNLQILKKVLEASQVKTPDYFLFMLGTDTQFTPKPTKDSKNDKVKKTYENGETLSYVAQLVAHQLRDDKADINIEQPLSFTTDSVDVVNGPTTLGPEVGERIAEGVFRVLKALAEGKETVLIAAHSRGAVETILITRELERIKEALKDNNKSGKALYQILCDSPCTLTKEAFKKFTYGNENKDVRDALYQQLEKAKINLFLIDPVPGGRFRFLPGTAWRDERFYIDPWCNEAELFLCEHERTRCFIPIVPNNVVPLVIPGHHGTASGNIYSQQGASVPDYILEKDTSLSQQLILQKLLNTINKRTGIFNKNSREVNLQQQAHRYF